MPLNIVITNNNSTINVSDGIEINRTFPKNRASVYKYGNSVVIKDGDDIVLSYTYSLFSYPSGTSVNDLVSKIQSFLNKEIKVEIGGSGISVLSDITTSENTPILQLDFVYGINTQVGTSTVANSATVDSDSQRLRLQSGTNSAGSAIFQSRNIAKYRPGQGISARFTPLFDTPYANSFQYWGVGNADDGYFFGYQGTSFGILHRIRTVDTAFVFQSNWNGDKCDGTGISQLNWNQKLGSPVKIEYPYLGFGDIKFFIQNPDDSSWILCHTIQYANTVNTTQVGNPSLSFYGQALNDGNATNITMYCGSVGVFLSGKRSFIGSPKWATDSNKSSITSEINLLTLKNATSYNGINNRGLVRINSVSFSSSAASGIAILRFKINSTLGGTPSFTTINGTTANGGATITSGNSIVSYDVAGTTVTGGTYIHSFTCDNPNSSGIINLIPFEIFLAPGETLTISGFSTISSTMSVAINWSEDI